MHHTFTSRIKRWKCAVIACFHFTLVFVRTESSLVVEIDTDERSRGGRRRWQIRDIHVEENVCVWLNDEWEREREGERESEWEFATCCFLDVEICSSRQPSDWGATGSGHKLEKTAEASGISSFRVIYCNASRRVDARGKPLLLGYVPTLGDRPSFAKVIQLFRPSLSKLMARSERTLAMFVVKNLSGRQYLHCQPKYWQYFSN